MYDTCVSTFAIKVNEEQNNALAWVGSSRSSTTNHYFRTTSHQPPHEKLNAYRLASLISICATILTVPFFTAVSVAVPCCQVYAWAVKEPRSASASASVRPTRASPVKLSRSSTSNDPTTLVWTLTFSTYAVKGIKRSISHLGQSKQIHSGLIVW